MKNPIFLFALAAICMGPVAARAQKPVPAVAKLPSWVSPLNVDLTQTSLDTEADEGYIDLLREKQVNVKAQTSYYRNIYKIINETGLQNRSTISVSFDPSYNQLSFHSIRIRRGRKLIDKLQPSRFKIIQQENELSRYLYNGSLSAVLILDDVRKGDIIEYSYSITGFNPVFSGKYCDLLDAGFDVPLYNLHYRVIIPADRKLNLRNRQTTAECTRTKLGKDSIFDWQLSHLAAIHAESDLPGWYDAFGTIMLSEFQNWNEVSRWAGQLFPGRFTPSPAMKSRVAAIKKKYKTNAYRFLALLRFVQDDVRYLGVEMGENSYKPNAPARVFEQRFGDCKDKAYLLMALCHMTGIDARPVLINTESGKYLHDWLPSALAFDHVAIRAEINGLYYWFDPTISYQRGKIDDIDFPDYGSGLLVSDTSRRITDFPEQQHGLVDIRERLTLKPDGDALLHVESDYSGSFADNLRSELHSNSLYSVRKQYQDFYGSYFDQPVLDSFTWKEEEANGHLLTRETYTVPRFWDPEKEDANLHFTPYVINSLLQQPREKERTMPFALAYPAHYREELTIELPDEWPANAGTADISCSAFLLKSRSSSAPRRLNLRYEYQSLKDHILPDESDSYLAALNKADAELSYTLLAAAPDTLQTLPVTPVQPVAQPKSGIPSWIFPAFTILMAAFFFWLGKRQKRVPLAASQRGRIIRMDEYSDTEESAEEE